MVGLLCFVLGILASPFKSKKAVKLATVSADSIHNWDHWWKMTGDQSRLLNVGDRVCWGASTTDLGTVVGTAWGGVTLSWDDGHTSSVRHNDMGEVTLVKVKV